MERRKRVWRIGFCFAGFVHSSSVLVLRRIERKSGPAAKRDKLPDVFVWNLYAGSSRPVFCYPTANCAQFIFSSDRWSETVRGVWYNKKIEARQSEALPICRTKNGGFLTS